MDPFRDTWAPKGCWTTGTTTWMLTCQHSFPSEFLVGSNTSISIWTQQTFLHWGTGLRIGQASTNNIRERHQGPNTTKRTAQGEESGVSLNSQPWSVVWVRGWAALRETLWDTQILHIQHSAQQDILVFSTWFLPPATQKELRRSSN